MKSDPEAKGRSGLMLAPMGTLRQWEGVKQYATNQAKKDIFSFRPRLLEVLKIYHDKLGLVNFQSARVVAGYDKVKAKWPNGPRIEEEFLESWKDLCYDLCFEFVALKIAYDALAKVIRQVLPSGMIGKKVVQSFSKMLKWMQEHAATGALPQEVLEAVLRRADDYCDLNRLRNEFVHRSGETITYRVDKEELGFEVLRGPGPQLLPLDRSGASEVKLMKPTLRAFVRAHFELAFEIESWALQQEASPPTVAPYWFTLPQAVIDLYGQIETFDVERCLTRLDDEEHDQGSERISLTGGQAK